MSQKVLNGILVILIFLFSVFENKSDEIHFHQILIFLKNWFHPLIFIPFILINYKTFKTWIGESKKSLLDPKRCLFPLIFIFFSVLIFVTRMRNQFDYISDDELKLLAYSNRLIFILLSTSLFTMVLSSFGAWSYIAQVFKNIFGSYKAPIWVSRLICSTWKLKNKKKEVLSSLILYSLLYGLGSFVVNYKPKYQKIKDGVQSASEDSKEKIKTISVYPTFPYAPNFKYENNEIKATKYPLQINFSENPYKLDSKIKAEQAFKMFPKIEGKWNKTGDYSFEFMPEGHWDTDTEYKVIIESENLRENISLNKDTLSFKLEPVNINIIQSRFYVNPKDSSEKKTVLEIKSNYPLDKKSLESNLTIYLRNSENDIVKSLGFNIFNDDRSQVFYIHTDSIELQAKHQEVFITINEGVVSQLKIKPTHKKRSEKVKIPSRYSFLKLNLGSIQVEEDENDEPYHSIKIDSNTRIKESEIKKFFTISKLKENFSKDEYKIIVQYYGEGADYCFQSYGEKHLKLSMDCDTLRNTDKKLHPILIEDRNIEYQFKSTTLIDETKHELLINPVVGGLYQLEIMRGLKTVDGYELEFNKKIITKARPFPRILKFTSEGSILSLKGDKKINLFARGLKLAKVKVKQIKAHQLHHFLSMSNSDKKNPRFNNYNFNFDNISDVYEEKINFTSSLKKGSYAEFDFNKYLSKRTKGSLNYGIFFVSLMDEDNKEKASQIFIVSDFAYIIKNDVENNRSLYLVSQKNEAPVSKVRVSSVELNGELKFICETDSEGRCDLPSQYRGHGVGYLVQKDQDTLFISDKGLDNQVDYSRFNISGEYGFEKKLRVSIFSDRKLYRPGERGHLGFIFKDSDWSRKYEREIINIEITDSRGKIFLTSDQKINTFGYNTLDFDLPYAAPTGNYNIIVSNYKSRSTAKKDYRYKTRIGSHSLKVQEFLPDKMKISASFNKGQSKLWVKPKDIIANISLRNLFGTAAVGNDVEASIILAPKQFLMPKYSSYKFFNDKVIEKTFTENLAKQKTDDEGRVQYNLDLEKYSQNTFLLTFHAEGFLKSGGRSVVSEKNILVSPHEFIIGMKSLGNLSYVSTKKSVDVNLIALDNTQHTTYADCEITIYEKKYQNVLVKQADQTYAYQDIKEPIVYKKESISIPATTLNYTLDNAKVGEYIVKIHDKNNNLLNSFEYNVVGEADLARSLYRSNELNLKLDRSDYANGDQIKLSIKSPYTGVGLITIEKEKVYSHKWIRLTRESTEVSMRVPAGLVGNGYVNVAILRSLNSDKVFTSPFSYAVQPFSLDKSKLIHDIDLQADTNVKPGEIISVKYRSKRAGKIIIYAVDKGIHQLANYVTPRPLDEFYKKQALRVSTYQIFSLIIPDIETLSAALASGGGEGALMSKSLNPFKRKFTKAVAFWSNILDSNSTWGSYSFQVPHHFNGELSLHAVYVDNQSVGVKKSSIISKDDIIITPTMPMFVSPGDEFTISATISNNLEPDGNKLDDIIDVSLKPSKAFKLIGPQTSKVKVKRAQDQVLTFKLKTLEKLGNAPIDIYAKISPDLSSHFQENLSIRPMYPKMNRNWQYLITEGGYEIDLSDTHFNDMYFDLTLDVSKGLFAMLRGEIKYLARYPYGCSEQITSKAIPYALFDNGMLNVTEKEKTEFLKQTYNTLLQRQLDNGAIALYPGNGAGSDYLNLYIAHFLMAAKLNNVFVNSRLLDHLMNYIEKLSQSKNKRTQAYSLYLLALNEKQVGAQAKMLAKDKSDDPYIDLYLAATFKILQDEKMAIFHIEKMEKNRKTYHYEYSYGYYQSSIERAYLGIIYSYFPDRANKNLIEIINKLVDSVKTYGSNSMWSGQTLLGLATQKTPSPAIIDLELEINDKKKMVKSTDFKNLTLSQKMNLKKIRLDIKEKMFGLLSLNMSGFPTKIKEYYNGFQISKRYLNTKGEEVETVQNGDEIYVELKIQADKTIRNAVIVDLLPGGFDLVWNNDNTKSNISEFKTNFNPDFVDEREDRIVLYTQLDSSTKTFYYTIKAIAPGKFITPPTYGENMYKTKESVLTKYGEIEIQN